MSYKYIFILFIIFLNSCAEQQKKINYNKNFKFYANKGFTLVYDEKLLKKKIVNRKIKERSLTVLSNNLEPETPVRITNLINGEFLVAKVGKETKFPFFYNSVISKRIAKELNLDLDEPYIEIKTINSKDSFIVGKAKMYKEEKKVADKAPVENITIKNIGNAKVNEEKKQIIAKTKNNFNYIIKIADFYFEDSAKILKNRLSSEFNINNLKITKISKNKFRVFKGPYKNIDSIKNQFNDIIKLDFDNIEIIKL
tara:strand:- start:491 stop:1252 length:762 start_codon:yes stop_codon:yes gene_type:complete